MIAFIEIAGAQQRDLARPEAGQADQFIIH